MTIHTVPAHDNRPPTITVYMTYDEAVATIHSLTHQILKQSPNSGRLETLCEDGHRFSVAVIPDTLDQ